MTLSFFMLQANGIQGFWEVEKTKDITIIENTVDGIRAKLGEQGPWYYYEKVSKREFVDKKGNSYRVESNNQLSWQSRDRSRIIKLFRINDGIGQGYISGKPGYQGQQISGYGTYAPESRLRNEDGFQDWYMEDGSRYSGHYIGRHFRHRSQIVAYLNGNWENRYGDRIIRIRRGGRNAIQVKFRKYLHGKTVFIQDRRYPNVFVDRHGHKIVLNKWGDIHIDLPGHGKMVLRKDNW